MEAWSRDYDTDKCTYQKIGDIFVRYGHSLILYTEYINGFEKATQAISDMYKKNTKFKAVMDEIHVSWQKKKINITIKTNKVQVLF